MYDYKDFESRMVPAYFISMIAAIDALKALMDEHRREHELLFEDLQKSASLMMRKRAYSNRKRSAGFPGYCNVMERVEKATSEDTFTVCGMLQLYRDVTGNGGTQESMPEDTAKSLEELCIAYYISRENVYIHPLILIPKVLFDFSAIAPFVKGNEVMLEILAQHLLKEHGYEAGRYAQLEKEAFSKTFREQVENGAYTELQFTELFLQGLKECYRKLEERYERMKERTLTKKMRIASIILESPEPISKAEILMCLPDVSETTVEAQLSALCKKGAIERVGTRKDAAYRKMQNGSESK